DYAFRFIDLFAGIGGIRKGFETIGGQCVFTSGFECEAQGTLFFDVARIIRAKKPAIFVLENVKNLKSHDKGKTFKVIMDTLDELGYEVADAAEMGKNDPKVIDGK
ncbi:DNA cytosine methyltransferase, partial [Klebsiella pneumoniae]|uniref:DNA cytosine methyltransferase n=1 Tax=Klebsiella pneumoniae TaxID=573 RepID=UPI0014822B72